MCLSTGAEGLKRLDRTLVTCKSPPLSYCTVCIGACCWYRPGQFVTSGKVQTSTLLRKVVILSCFLKIYRKIVVVAAIIALMNYSKGWKKYLQTGA